MASDKKLINNEEYSQLFTSRLLSRKLSIDEINYKCKQRAKRIGDYILGEVLGEGSFGKVREGYNIKTRELFAIKVFKKRNLRRIPQGEENVMREIAILQKVNHHNIIHLYNHFKEENQNLYLVLEYVGGSCLKRLLEKAPSKTLPLNQARHIFTQLLDVVEYLHGIGIVHQDIKPDNILCNPDGNIKLTDFGVATDVKDETGPVRRCTGCPGFQPPEVANGSLTFPKKTTDIWQLGIVLYIMTVGKYPFEGNTLHDLIENISNGKFTFPPTMDGSLRDLISHILTTNPEDRLTIEQIRKHSWMEANLHTQEFIMPALAPTIFRPRKTSRFCASECTIS